MEVRQLNGVDVPVDVLDLAAVDPRVNELLYQATTIDFGAKGLDLLIKLRGVTSTYHWTLKTAHCSPMAERICHGVARKAAEARGTPMPAPFEPAKHDPKTHAVSLIKAYQITLQDVADAIGGDQEEAADILGGSQQYTPSQRRKLVCLLKARTPSAMTDEQDQISHERACRQHQGRLNDKLPELERLANYEHRFMRQIQRNTDLLNELQCRRRNRDLIPGSFSENIFSRG